MPRINIISVNKLFTDEEVKLLQEKGFELVYGEDISEAVNTFLAEPPDALIIEKDLPAQMDKTIIQTITSNLQLALMPIVLVSAKDREGLFCIDWSEYPVDEIFFIGASLKEKLARIELALKRVEKVADNNPLTKLPGNTSILKHIQNILENDLKETMVVGYVDIDNFKPYNDKYGFARGDEVIRLVARIFVNVVNEEAKRKGFVGHIGGDDFVFIVPADKAEAVCQKALASFASLIPLFIDEEDREAGCFISVDRQGNKQTFAITSLSIVGVVCSPSRYKHYGEVSQVAAQMKKKVKSLPGNNYLIDRRKD